MSTLKIGPGFATVSTAVEFIARRSSTKRIEIPCRPRTDPESDFIDVRQVGSHQGEARSEVSGQIDSRICARVDLASNSWMDFDTVDLGGTAERSACLKSLSRVRGDVKIRS